PLGKTACFPRRRQERDAADCSDGTPSGVPSDNPILRIMRGGQRRIYEWQRLATKVNAWQLGGNSCSLKRRYAGFRERLDPLPGDQFMDAQPVVVAQPDCLWRQWAREHPKRSAVG